MTINFRQYKLRELLKLFIKITKLRDFVYTEKKNLTSIKNFCFFEIEFMFS